MISKGPLGFWSYWFLSSHWVPSLPLQVLGSICESMQYDTTYFLLGASLFQHVDLVTISLRAGFQVYLSWPSGFCVCMPRQYKTTCWEFDLISGFFVFFSWLIVLADGINKCDWYLAGGTEC